jgi:hypothetical protein
VRLDRKGVVRLVREDGHTEERDARVDGLQHGVGAAVRDEGACLRVRLKKSKNTINLCKKDLKMENFIYFN